MTQTVVLLRKSSDGMFVKAKHVTNVEWVESSGLGLRDTAKASFLGRTNFDFDSIVLLHPESSGRFRIFGPYDIERSGLSGEEKLFSLEASSNYHWESRLAAQQTETENAIINHMLSGIRDLAKFHPYDEWYGGTETDVRYPSLQTVLDHISTDLQAATQFNELIQACEKWGLTAYNDSVPLISRAGDTIGQTLEISVRPKYPVNLTDQYDYYTVKYSDGKVTDRQTERVQAMTAIGGHIQAGTPDSIPDQVDKPDAWRNRAIESSERSFGHSPDVRYVTQGTEGPTVFVETETGDIAHFNIDLERWKLQNESEVMQLVRYGNINPIGPHFIVTHDNRQWRVVGVKHSNKAGLYSQSLDLALWQGIPVVGF